MGWKWKKEPEAPPLPPMAERRRRAYSNGLVAGREGREESFNPYAPTGPLKVLWEQWKEGYRDAKAF